MVEKVFLASLFFFFVCLGFGVKFSAEVKENFD